MGVLSTGGDAESFVNPPVNRYAGIMGRVTSASKQPYRKAVISEQERLSRIEEQKLIAKTARKMKAQEVDTPTARDAALYRDVQAATGTDRRRRGLLSTNARNDVEQQILADAKAGMRADEIAARRAMAMREGAAVKASFKSGAQTAKGIWAQRDKVGFEAGRAAGIAMRHQQVNFSEQQRNLQQMFGWGGKIWGTNMRPVSVNNDLNPSQSDPWDETSSMFGWGEQRERSGLF